MKYRLLLLSIFALLSSCKNDGGSDQATYIDVVARIEDNDVSKAEVSGSAFVEGQNFGVYVVPQVNVTTDGVLRPSGNYRDNLQYVVGVGGVITPDPSAVFPNNVTKVGLYGFYPYATSGSVYSISANNEISVVLPKDQTVAASYEKSDFMYAYAGAVAPSGSAANLTFNHMMSKITLNLVVPSTYLGVAVSEVSSVVFSGVKTKSVFTNIASPITVVSSEVGNLSMLKKSETAGTFVYNAICAPSGSVADGFKVDVKIKAGANTHSFTYLGSHKFESGKNNVISLKLKEESAQLVQLGSVTIVGWGADVEVPSDGEVLGVKDRFSFASGVDLKSLTAVSVVCNDGYTYTIAKSNLVINGQDIKFGFSGKLSESPEKYPYALTKIVLTGTGSEFDLSGATVSGPSATDIVLVKK